MFTRPKVLRAQTLEILEAEMTKDKKIKDLLKVLDMPEDEQWEWVIAGEKVIKYFPDDDIFIGDPQKYLADLAFRLRDEAISEDSDSWARACWYVQQWINLHEIKTWNIPSFDGLNNAEHEILTKDAIVWIVAASIMKELANGK